MPPIEQIEAWLKETILGLIILGALGSIVAVWVFRLGAKLVALFRHGRQVFKQREYQKGYAAGVVVTYVQLKGDAVVGIAWFAWKVVLFLTAMSALVVAAIVTVLLLTVNEPRVLSLDSFFSVAVSFLAVRWMYEEFREVRSAYGTLVLPIIEKAKQAKQGTDSAKQ